MSDSKQPKEKRDTKPTDKGADSYRRLEGDIFKFKNKDRYKTKQLKEQAMALLVPGYLGYVFNID